jgi:glycosyltransferase involved in cell wall biosynthesis
MSFKKAANCKKIKISIVGSAGVPARYGGFETLAENLVKRRTDNNIEYTVFCSAKLYPKKEKKYFSAKLNYIYINANRKSSIIYDLICMLFSLRSDIMLILGISGSIFLPLIKLTYRGKIITNIDGIEWKREKWNKNARNFLRVSERFAVKYSDVVIGDNQEIINYVNKTYKKDAFFIEYGSDTIHEKQNKILEYSFIKKPYAISVCRIEPENNIHLILEAFSRQDKISLIIVGNWKGNKYGLALFEKYKEYAHIHLMEPIYDTEKINFLRSCALVYAHGHSAGGTNPSLVEAMHSCLPIFAFDCVYNRNTTENQCIYWSTVDELYTNIIQYKESQLNEIKMNMKLIAEKRFMWNIIVSKYEALFRSNSILNNKG